MKHAPETLPNDVDSLKELVHELQQKNAHQSDYINQLIEAIQLAKHQHFGSRSEKFNSDQLSLLFNEAEAFADQQSFAPDVRLREAHDSRR